MPKLLGVSLKLPDHQYSQDEILQRLLCTTSMTTEQSQLVSHFFAQTSVKSRHFALPIECYQTKMTFTERNQLWQQEALNLSTQAVQELLERFDLPPVRIDLLATSTVTGLSVPTLDAKLMNALEFSPTTKRLPIFGLGCVAGVAGLNRVAEYLQGHPTSAALFVGVELCSLTFQMHDTSKANLVATSLFGDGCGVALIVGDAHPLAHKSGLKFLGAQSHFFKNSEEVMGWNIGESGFQVVLNNQVPEYVRKGLGALTDGARFRHGFNMEDIKFAFTHPGGPKVIEAVKECWPFPDSYYADTWKNLERFGNMSSVSVLANLSDFFNRNPLPQGKGLSLAFGPAFCAELGVWES